MRSLAIVLLAAGVARAEQVKEPSTGQVFESTRSDGGKNLFLMGVGLRRKVVVNVYAMALYVDEEEAKRNFPALAARAGGSDKAKLTAGDHAQSFVTWGSFAKLAVLHFVRDVDAEKIRNAFKDGLEEALSEKSPDDVRMGAQTFLDMFDRDMKNGEEIVLRTSADGKIEVQLAGNRKFGPHSPKLARAVWGIWLGSKPISKDLRAQLVSRVDLLAKP